MIIDKLVKRVAQQGFVCVGLDTHLDFIPSHLKQQYPKLSEQIFQFNKAIIDATKAHVALYKPQIAYYEAHGLAGLQAYRQTLDYLRKNDCLIIGDVKRGDIASTAQMYAQAHFSGDFEVDFITLNPYMGYDSITPYLPYLASGKKGLFVLLRTSNPGAKDIEYLQVDDKPLYSHVGDALVEIGKAYIGQSGYSSLGLVVGGTHTEEAQEIRARYPNSFFLIPGYGAQGGKADDIRQYLSNFNGGVVNSSRGILTYYKKFDDGEDNFAHYALQAVLAMKADIYGESN